MKIYSVIISKDAIAKAINTPGEKFDNLKKKILNILKDNPQGITEKDLLSKLSDKDPESTRTILAIMDTEESIQTEILIKLVP